MARLKKKEHENLSATNIEKVIALLGTEKPITKKAACEILNISYNTTRLASIIEDYIHQKELTQKRKKEKRGTPLTPQEIRGIIEDFLQGESIADISKRYYRGSELIKNFISSAGIPERVSGEDKYRIAVLPEACVAEEFLDGERAWSAVYHTPCTIVKKLDQQHTDKYATVCYHIYISEAVGQESNFPQVKAGGFNAFTPSYDLGKLTHLEKYGVTI